MFVAGGQFYVFIASIAFGGACGILFSISHLIKLGITNVIIRIFPDIIAFTLTAIAYVLYSHLLHFPNFRLYMALGVLTGIAIYFKSFHILLAKCLKTLYNKCVKIFSKINILKRDKREDGRIKS